MLLEKLVNTKKSLLKSGGSLQESILSSYTTKEDLSNSIIGCYATVDNDPTTRINIHFHIKESDSDKLNVMEYRVTGGEWATKTVSHTKDYLGTDKVIKCFNLIDLVPNTVYEVRLEGDKKSYTFRTLPQTNERDIRVAFTSDITHGGDTMKNNLAKGALARYSPDMIVMVGDIAHADGRIVSRWEAFWEAWLNYGFTEEGHMIPIVATLGNHDGFTDEGMSQLWYFDDKVISIPYFYNFFPKYEGNTSYGVIDIGSYLSIIMLDSGHGVPIEGEQTTWLENVLQQRSDRVVIPAMHYSPYPGAYGYDDGSWVAPYIRTLWTTLFKQHNIKVAYSGHNHTFTVSPPVSGDETDVNGTIYIGQGASFGTILRDMVNADKWFVEESGQGEYYRHFIGMTLTNNYLHVKAISVDDNILYSTTFNVAE